MQANLPTILGRLRADLDPGTKAARMSFYDPFLVDEQVAQQSLDVINALNATEIDNYERFGFSESSDR